MNMRDITVRADALHKRLTLAFPEFEWEITQYSKGKRDSRIRWSITAKENPREAEA